MVREHTLMPLMSEITLMLAVTVTGDVVLMAVVESVIPVIDGANMSPGEV